MSGTWQAVLCLLAVMLAGPSEAPADAMSGERGPHAGSDLAKHSRLHLPVQLTEVEPDRAEAKERRKEYIQGVLSRGEVRGKRLALTGSAFFIASSGSLITSLKLVSDCVLVSVWPIVGNMVLADEIIPDPSTGLALLRTKVRPSAIASLAGSKGALSRSPIYILGYPSLGLITTAPALTPVAALGAQSTVFSRSTILITGDIRLGNSGGPLLDSAGAVVGTVMPHNTDAYAAVEGGPLNVGLAVPSEDLRVFLETHDVRHQFGLQLPPKPPDRLLVDARLFMAQVGCWQQD